MKEPVDHVLRPRLPWRSTADPAVTECGYDASKVKSITRDEYFRREKDFGKQRTAMLTCMTCSDAARRWGTWADDPRLAVQREVEWERNGAYYRRNSPNERGTLLRNELTAIADLIEAHREEFDTFLSAIRGRREWNEKKAAMQNKPKRRDSPVTGL